MLILVSASIFLQQIPQLFPWVRDGNKAKCCLVLSFLLVLLLSSARIQHLVRRHQQKERGCTSGLDAFGMCRFTAFCSLEYFRYKS